MKFLDVKNIIINTNNAIILYLERNFMKNYRFMSMAAILAAILDFEKATRVARVASGHPG